MNDDDTLTLLAVHSACERTEKAGYTYDSLEFAIRDIRTALGRIGGGTLPDRFYQSRKKCESLHEQFKLLKQMCDDGEKEAEQILSLTKTESDSLMHALSEARLRGRKRSDEILTQDDMFTSDEFASLMDISIDKLSRMVEKHEVIALYSDTKLRFPVWQLNKLNRPFSRLPELFEKLSSNPWSVYRFCMQSFSEANGKTGLELLTSNKWSVIFDIIEGINNGNFS